MWANETGAQVNQETVCFHLYLAWQMGIDVQRVTPASGCPGSNPSSAFAHPGPCKAAPDLGVSICKMGIIIAPLS